MGNENGNLGPVASADESVFDSLGAATGCETGEVGSAGVVAGWLAVICAQDAGSDALAPDDVLGLDGTLVGAGGETA